MNRLALNRKCLWKLAVDHGLAFCGKDKKRLSRKAKSLFFEPVRADAARLYEELQNSRLVWEIMIERKMLPEWIKLVTFQRWMSRGL